MEKKPKKIGVYICHCGGNISDYVDVEKVRQSVEGEDIVFIAKTTMFACSDANQRDMVEDIKANDLGDAVGLHPDYANHIFKKAFGTTISDYIAELRIAHAQRKLLTTDMSITDIAYECGFNSIARFNATFFKKTQCTPREYKKKIVK